MLAQCVQGLTDLQRLIGGLALLRGHQIHTLSLLVERGRQLTVNFELIDDARRQVFAVFSQQFGALQRALGFTLALTVQLITQGLQIGIADERGEIAASVNGVPRLDVGDNTDVMGGCAKCRAMELMIRAMSPQVLITDEIATAEDAEAVMDASGCGIRVIASAHAGSAAEIMRRRDISAIIAAGAFNKVLLLKKQGTERRLYDITEELT